MKNCGVDEILSFLLFCLLFIVESIGVPMVPPTHPFLQSGKKKRIHGRRGIVVFYGLLVAAALNEALREEVQRLKIATGQIPAANGNPFGRGLPPQFPSQPQMFQHFNNNQAQPAQHQQQLHMSQSTTNNQTRSAQPQPSFSDFN